MWGRRKLINSFPSPPPSQWAFRRPGGRKEFVGLDSEHGLKGENVETNRLHVWCGVSAV